MEQQIQLHFPQLYLYFVKYYASVPIVYFKSTMEEFIRVAAQGVRFPRGCLVDAVLWVSLSTCFRCHDWGVPTGFVKDIIDDTVLVGSEDESIAAIRILQGIGRSYSWHFSEPCLAPEHWNCSLPHIEITTVGWARLIFSNYSLGIRNTHPLKFLTM
jgi:hypothetical protein